MADRHFYGDDCPGGHGSAVVAGVDPDDQLTAQEANELDAADRAAGWPADLPPPPDPAHKALAFALARALPRAYRRDADGVHHWDAPVLAEYLTAAGWRHEPGTLNSAADDLDAALFGDDADPDPVGWLRARAAEKEAGRA